ncbi:hypothetical protein V9T40_000535 [Parthenolecanium corni]|uniref:Solute carrier family 12 member 8 n=1 Tax=Parthenolecanium corni TaxID=536013 RepID=A0AAN9TB77_9HEMI
MNSANKPKNAIDLNKFGLESSESEAIPDVETVGFSSGGYRPTNRNELFAGEENAQPWWKSQFFISQPVLFGMWDGVFTSCLINIFGVLVFLRSGWIVAQAGILNAVLIVLSTVSIGLITVLSGIGVCERCRVESGGVYFLLSHVLGPRSAAAVGLLYVFGQAVGCSLNLLGFGESIAGLFNLQTNKWAEKLFASAAVLLLWMINSFGVKWVIKIQFLLLLVLLFAGLDFAVGSFVHTDEKNGFQGWISDNFVENLFPLYTNGYSWFSVFAVFFPAITGVLAGINMSGDLSRPSEDIPNGTLAALFTGAGLYLVFVTFLGSTCTRAALLTDFTIAAKVSAFSILLLAGVYVSSMSSCLGAMYGTPRVLQSIANEKVIPVIGFLGQGRGPNKVPVLAMLVIAMIIIIFTLVGDINTLAPIVTMPFLLTYAALDYAYFALAQSFDIQHQREQRFKKSVAASSGYHSFAILSEESEDLDALFPERNTSRANNLNSSALDDSPAVAIHSKTGNWYSGLCNRWLSLFGAIVNVCLMCVVDSKYAIGTIVIVLLIWVYIGLANPAVKPGTANEFKFLHFLRRTIFRLFRRRVTEYEEIIVTPIYPPGDFESSQITEENEDFAGRQRFHQTANVQPVIGKQIRPSDSVQILQ